MASDKNYLEYILDCLSEAPEIKTRQMMGEYIIYCRGTVVGGIYDNRFLIKPTASAKRLLPDAPYELPYDGAKEMLLVTETDDKAFLAELLSAVADEVPAGRKKQRKDDFELLMTALKKRDEILRETPDKIGTYNKYFDKMKKAAHALIAQGRQAEMLPLLDNKSVSIAHDVAGLLYHCYPELCRKKEEEISKMTVPTGLEKCYVMCSVSAAMGLEYGIPDDYP